MSLSEKQPRKELYGTFKQMGLAYWYILDSARRRVGEEMAVSLMKEAMYRLGGHTGARLASHAPRDMDGLRAAFLKLVPDEGASFQPRVTRCDAEGLDIKIGQCLLKDAWQAAEVPPEDVMKLCQVAGCLDNGTFERACFAFSADTWKPGQEGCCHMHIRPR
jgi:hypothetical protein